MFVKDIPYQPHHPLISAIQLEEKPALPLGYFCGYNPVRSSPDSFAVVLYPEQLTLGWESYHKTGKGMRAAGNEHLSVATLIPTQVLYHTPHHKSKKE